MIQGDPPLGIVSFTKIPWFCGKSKKQENSVMHVTFFWSRAPSFCTSNLWGTKDFIPPSRLSHPTCKFLWQPIWLSYSCQFRILWTDNTHWNWLSCDSRQNSSWCPPLSNCFQVSISRHIDQTPPSLPFYNIAFQVWNDWYSFHL